MIGLDDGVVIVGASLAGLSCADALRAAGYRGKLSLIGDEPRHPYDRTPLTKAVLVGRTRAERTPLALRGAADANWLLGTAAARVDRDNHTVVLTDGRTIAFSALVVASGVRARPWPTSDEAGLTGVHTVRSVDDAAALATALSANPGHVVVVGGGFIACEVASACSELGIKCTLVARGSSLLSSALGDTIGRVVGRIARANGVDVRTRSGVDELIGADGAARKVRLTTGEIIGADVVVLATGSVGNVEWLQGAGLDLTGGRVRCNARLQALRADGAADPEVLAVGDVSSLLRVSDPGRLIAVEHWGSAVTQGCYAARSLLAGDGDIEPYDEVSCFWSDVWGVNVKSLGEPSLAEEVQVVRGDLDAGAFTALYGASGRVVGAVAFDMPRELTFAAPLVAEGAAFPFRGPVADSRAAVDTVQPAGVRPKKADPNRDDAGPAIASPFSRRTV